MKRLSALICTVLGLSSPAMAGETHRVFLEQGDGARIQIATLDLAPDGRYSVEMQDDAFGNHFLSMRPFKCLEGPSKNWCHVPYPYEIKRDISADLTDLEYDFLFLWKGSTEYGINMWNGIYYQIEPAGDGFVGVLHEMDMGLLAVPPDAGILRPLRAQDIIESDPSSHWLPRLVIE